MRAGTRRKRGRKVRRREAGQVCMQIPDCMATLRQSKFGLFGLLVKHEFLESQGWFGPYVPIVERADSIPWCDIQVSV